MSTATIRDELAPAKEEILEHLRAVLADRRFASAERNAGFLSYVVQRALEGKAAEIKETVIATEVYGRSTDYDPKADSIVRVEANRLRQKLRSYYENEGRHAPLRFDLPSGSYVPQFARSRLPAPCPVQPDAPGEQELAAPIAAVHPPHWHVWLTLGRIATLIVFATAAVLLIFQSLNGAKNTGPQNADAVAAWQEGVALLSQDPHMGATDRGAPPTLRRAIERLEFAVARSPGFAPAWATLAEAYDYAFPYLGRDPAEDTRRAEAAARRSIKLDHRLAAGHRMLGQVLGFLKWDFAPAEKSIRQAVALDPRDAYAAMEYADLLCLTGRAAQAADEIRKARALLPALPQLAVKEAEIDLLLKRPAAAIAAAQSALELKQDYMRAHLALGMAYELQGDFPKALARYEHVLRINPKDRRALPAYGYLLAQTGQSEQARSVARQLESLNANIRNCAFQVAVVYAGLGEDEQAIDWLERAWQTHQTHFPFAALEPRFRRLHQQPRFRALLARVGLQPMP